MKSVRKVFNALTDTAPLISKSGVEKAKILLAQLKKLQENQNCSRSPYSITMVQQVITFIDFLLLHNQIKQGLHIVTESNKLMSLLDNGRNTSLPEVFNEESYQLLTCLLDMFKKLNTNEDLTLAAIKFLEIDPENAEEIIFNNLEITKATMGTRLKLYEHLTEKEDWQKRTANIIHEISRLKARIEQCEQTDEIIDSYKKESARLLEAAKTLPYHGISVRGQTNPFDNAANPYILDPEKITYTEYRRAILLALLDAELTLNKKRNVEEKKYHTSMHVLLVHSFDPIYLEKRESYLSRRIEKLVNNQKTYQNKLKTHAKKREISAELTQTITNLCQQFAVNLIEKYFSIFNALLKAGIDEHDVNKKYKLNVGELSPTLFYSMLDFFQHILRSYENTDTKILQAIAHYEKELGLKDSFPDLLANKTTALDKEIGEFETLSM